MNQTIKERKIIKTGDRIVWADTNGTDIGTIICIEKTRKQEKFGKRVFSISWREAQADYCIIILDSGHWIHGSQVINII